MRNHKLKKRLTILKNHHKLNCSKLFIIFKYTNRVSVHFHEPDIYAHFHELGCVSTVTSMIYKQTNIQPQNKKS